MAAALSLRTPRTWADYVRGAGATPKDISERTGVSQSLVSRWLSGKVHPSAENVVAFARAFNGRPVEALMAAGYLNSDEVEGAFEVLPSPKSFTDRELLIELAERLAHRNADDITDSLSASDDLLKGRQDRPRLV